MQHTTTPYAPQIIERLLQALDSGPLEFRAASAKLIEPATPLPIGTETDPVLILATINHQLFCSYSSYPFIKPIHILEELLRLPTCAPAMLAEIHSQLGYAYSLAYIYQSEKIAKSLYHFKQAINIYKQLQRDNGSAIVYLRHAIAASRLGKQPAAHRSVAKACEFAQKSEIRTYQNRTQLWRECINFRSNNSHQDVYKSVDNFLLLQTTGLSDDDYSISQALLYCCAQHNHDLKLAERHLRAHVESFATTSTTHGEVAVVQITHALDAGRYTHGVDIGFDFLEYAPLASAIYHREISAKLSSASKVMPAALQEWLRTYSQTYGSPTQQIPSYDLVSNHDSLMQAFPFLRAIRATEHG